MMPKEGIHGGNIWQFARKYGFDPREVLDFSSNASPLPLPEEARELAYGALEDLRRYPDREYLDLRTALAGYTGCPLDWIMAGNGATELLYLVARSLRPARVLLPVPSFGDYERAFYGTDCRLEYFYLEEEADFRLDTGAFLDRLRQGFEMTILCNPNNPTGRLIPREELLAVIEEAARTGAAVLVDETFVEFAPEPEEASVLRELENYDNLLVLRALTKFFGVPGLRLGYLLANPGLLEKLLPYREPWTVNTLACTLGPFLLGHGEFIRKTREWIMTERPFLFEGLRHIDKLKTYESAASFFLLKSLDEKWNAGMLQAVLAAEKILIRDASSFVSLDKRFFRLAVKDRQGNEKLIQALRYFL
ncbi:MAG: threonine-phosphate decarboxylase CobD [Peptococcaceae bacterium]|jgi:threonine-phosphate decarboxylase|nr:threonine-phosphate decarboxylase CobD [Peptococcaceae bacterium]MDH7525794.1 threonine-phosphate decarboxylase CobD [Peptococcaceae bacterium]